MSVFYSVLLSRLRNTSLLHDKGSQTFAEAPLNT